jgi:hypothetical protein
MKKNYKARLLCLSLIATYLPITASAAHLHAIAGSRQAGMGRTSVTLTDFWSCLNNQAGVALLDKVSAGIFYENRFLLDELSNKGVGLTIPTRIGTIGFTCNHFGFQLYSEVTIGLLYARSFSPYFRIGLQLDFMRTSLGESYGSKNNITFEIGIQSDITNSLTIGVWTFNPIQVVIAEYNNERLPAIFRIGLQWKVTEDLLLCLDTEKNTLISPVILRGGLEYGIKERFYLRCGFSSMEEIFSLGFGMKIKLLKLDLSASMHETLGFSPQASLVFQF